MGLGKAFRRKFVQTTRAVGPAGARRSFPGHQRQHLRPLPLPQQIPSETVQYLEQCGTKDGIARRGYVQNCMVKYLLINNLQIYLKLLDAVTTWPVSCSSLTVCILAPLTFAGAGSTNGCQSRPEDPEPAAPCCDVTASQRDAFETGRNSPVSFLLFDSPE